MRVQRSNSHIVHFARQLVPRASARQLSAAQAGPARDVTQLHVYLVLHGRNHPAGNYSLLPDSEHTRAGSHDVTRA